MRQCPTSLLANSGRDGLGGDPARLRDHDVEVLPPLHVVVHDELRQLGRLAATREAGDDRDLNKHDELK